LQAPRTRPQMPEEGGLQEVVVTAQKRSEDLQKVPISLQVLSREKLDQLQVHDLDDYAKLLPSVTFRSNGPGQAELFFERNSTCRTCRCTTKWPVRKTSITVRRCRAPTATTRCSVKPASTSPIN